ncbi:MAG: hypothetical protein CMF43_04120 [Legionellales bacterium]|nr:hypothetical protein [Legionellales bacterium]
MLGSSGLNLILSINRWIQMPVPTAERLLCDRHRRLAIANRSLTDLSKTRHHAAASVHQFNVS